MLQKLLLFAWIGFAIVLVNCKGKDGAVGPAGTAGAAGAVGPAGPAGADGTSSGGAFILSTGADTTDETGGFITGFTGLDAAGLATLDSSAVLVYLKTGGAYWPLPGLVSFGPKKISQFTFFHGINDQTFFVQVIPTDWSDSTTNAPVRIVQDFRVVIIPGTSLRLNADVNLKSYEATIAALGLTENDVKISTRRYARHR